jgi:site-specific recombinase XerD
MVAMDTTQPPDVTAFLTDLDLQVKAEQTWRAYRSDLTLFATWFQRTTGGNLATSPFTPVVRSS